MNFKIFYIFALIFIASCTKSYYFEKSPCPALEYRYKKQNVDKKEDKKEEIKKEEKEKKQVLNPKFR